MGFLSYLSFEQLWENNGSSSEIRGVVASDEYISTTNLLNLNFTTDGDVQRSGFEATFTLSKAAYTLLKMILVFQFDYYHRQLVYG